MRIFALSDVHIDFRANAAWVADISTADYRNDVLILAGDLTDELRLMEWCLGLLVTRFRKVLFVPGNHDLWVLRDSHSKTSLEKFLTVSSLVAFCGASMQIFNENRLMIVPLLGWYDYSFGEPSEELKSIWMDYHACRWPNGFTEKDAAEYFAKRNSEQADKESDTVITFSHFLPRIDIMPDFIPDAMKLLYPVLGSTQLERQLRLYSPSIHVYGHSHINQNIEISGVCYINNAFGYPNETRMTAKRLVCIHEC